MAELRIDGDLLRVELPPREAAKSFHRSFSVPLSAIRRVRTPHNAWAELRGWRSTGITIPGRTAFGTRRHGGGYDFVAVRRQDPTVLVELNGARYGEIMVSVSDPATVARDIAAAAGIAAD